MTLSISIAERRNGRTKSIVTIDDCRFTNPNRITAIIFPSPFVNETAHEEGFVRYFLSASAEVWQDLSGQVVAASPLNIPAGDERIRYLEGMVETILGGGLRGVQFPPHPVKIGQEWRSQVDATKFMKQPASNDIKFDGLISTHAKRLTALDPRFSFIHFAVNGNPKVTISGEPWQIKVEGKGSAVVQSDSGVTSSSKSGCLITSKHGRDVTKQRITIEIKKL